MNDDPMRRAPHIAGMDALRHLGSGGFADVYLYQQHRPSRRVAVKVLKEIDLTDLARAQFAAEADSMASLAEHPNIVPVYAVDEAPDGRPYIVMAYYPRPSLATSAARAPLSAPEALRVGVLISGAVQTAHQFGICIATSNRRTS